MKSALLVVVLMLVACSGDAPVHSDYNPTVDFSKYRSFNFDKPVIQAANNSVVRDPQVLDTIRRVIVDDLGSRPMLWRETGGDLSITIMLAASEETAVDQWGMSWDREGGIYPGGETFEFKAGTMVIDFFDAASGQLVWRGWAHSAITRTGDPDLGLLAELVAAMLEQYPPTPEKE